MELNVFVVVNDAAKTELERGNFEASEVASRIASKIDPGQSTAQQLRCVIRAFEEERYSEWPAHWQLAGKMNLLRSFLQSKTTDVHDHTREQRASYAELEEWPELLRNITYGLTPVLPLDDRSRFVDELIKAGKRKCPPGDEMNAPKEDDIMHVALSYRHAARYCDGGTISHETATEAFDCIMRFLHLSKGRGRLRGVRVWVDQNLHRYVDTSSQWYKFGFLPYAAYLVVSVLSEHGGFKVARKRPWLWVETDLALKGVGMITVPDVYSTFTEIIVCPNDQAFQFHPESGYYLGRRSPLLFTVVSILISVSLWTPDVLEHSAYQFQKEFRRFALWAKAQLVRLRTFNSFDMSSLEFEDTYIENIAWVRALPHSRPLCRMLQPFFLRIESRASAMNHLLRLMKMSRCVQITKVSSEECQDMLHYEIFGDSEKDIFCFRESGGNVMLNVNPLPQSTNASYSSEFEEHERRRQHYTQLYNDRRGLHSVWDARFDQGHIQQHSVCGTIFDRQFSTVDEVRNLGRKVTVGDEEFIIDGFSLTGPFAVGIYRRVKPSFQSPDLFLRDSDVVCIKKLERAEQIALVSSLCDEDAVQATNRVVETSATESEKHLSAKQFTCARSFGTEPSEILNVNFEVFIDSVQRSWFVQGSDQLLVRKKVLIENVITLSTTDLRVGQVDYTFTTTLSLPGSHPLDTLQVGCHGDVAMTLKKLAMLMGDTKAEHVTVCTIERVGRPCVEKKRYRMVLEGGELLQCGACGRIFSSINHRQCEIQSGYNWGDTATVSWNGLHYCGWASSGQYDVRFQEEFSRKPDLEMTHQYIEWFQ